MADQSYVFNVSKGDMLDGDFQWLASGGGDFRLIPVMTNTTIADPTEDNSGTEAQDLTTVGAITTLDEFDGSGYTTGVGGLALTEIDAAVDNANNRAEADADDLTFSSQGKGTRQIHGYLLIRFVTNQASSRPVGFYLVNDFNPNGGDVDVIPDAEGLINLT